MVWYKFICHCVKNVKSFLMQYTRTPDTLSVIVACTVSAPAEERITLFRYGEEIISILEN